MDRQLNVLVANGHTRLTNKPNPQVGIYRGNDPTHGQNYGALYNDIAAAYGDALRWKVSDDKRYADKAVEYLDQWASTLTTLGGSDVALAAGITATSSPTQPKSCAATAAESGRTRRVSGNDAQGLHPVSHAFLTRIDTAMDTHWATGARPTSRASPSACAATTPSFRQRGRHPFQDRRQQRLHPASRVLPAPRQPGQWQEAARATARSAD